MKRYWEYMKEYQEHFENATADKYIRKPEDFIACKFLRDNDIIHLWQSENRKKLLNEILPKYAYVERLLFFDAIRTVFYEWE